MWRVDTSAVEHVWFRLRLNCSHSKSSCSLCRSPPFIHFRITASVQQEILQIHTRERLFWMKTSNTQKDQQYSRGELILCFISKKCFTCIVFFIFLVITLSCAPMILLSHSKVKSLTRDRPETKLSNSLSRRSCFLTFSH